MNEIQILLKELEKIKSYPTCMERIGGEIEGLGFFPGGKGLFTSDNIISNKPIMILGHDFGAKRDFISSVRRKEENQSIWMWKNLNKMFEAHSIPKNDCFLTNVIMGVRVEESAIAANPSYKKFPDFVNDCISFLKFQIALQKPKTILVLGGHLFDILSKISTDLSKLKEIKSFSELDENHLSNFQNISINNIENYKTNIAFLTHPSTHFWERNMSNRKISEIVIVKQAILS